MVEEEIKRLITYDGISEKEIKKLNEKFVETLKKIEKAKKRLRKKKK